MTILSRALRYAIAAALIVAPASSALRAQTKAEYDALKREVEALRQRQDALQKQVDALLAGGAAAPAATIDTLKLEHAPLRGSATAKVTLVEVSDFQCPFCGRYFNQTMPQIQNEYVDTGKISYAFVHMPLSIHPNAFDAAQAAACAADQGKFWEMHDRLFANQALLAPNYLAEKARGLVANQETYKSCLEMSRHSAEIRSDMAMASAAGATATPAFFIGSLDAKTKTLKISRKIIGAKAYAVFQGVLDDALKTAK